MKKAIKILLYILITITALQAFAEPIDGYWKSMGRNRKATGIWKFYERDGVAYGICLLAYGLSPDIRLDTCTRKYPGHPVREKDLSDLYMYKTPLIFGLIKNSKDEWIDGKIVDSRNGKMYLCRASVHSADNKKYKVRTLALRGEIIRGIGITQYWEAMTPEEVNRDILQTITKFGSAYAKGHQEDFLVPVP